METTRIPTDYRVIETHIRNAKLERSIAVAQFMADAADALGRGVMRAVTAVLGSLSTARRIHTIEVEAIAKRHAAH